MREIMNTLRYAGMNFVSSLASSRTNVCVLVWNVADLYAIWLVFTRLHYVWFIAMYSNKNEISGSFDNWGWAPESKNKMSMGELDLLLDAMTCLGESFHQFFKGVWRLEKPIFCQIQSIFSWVHNEFGATLANIP